MDSIRLHKERGLDPHLLMCPVCGETDGRNPMSEGKERFFALVRTDGEIAEFGKFEDYEQAMEEADEVFKDDWVHVWNEEDLKSLGKSITELLNKER